MSWNYNEYKNWLFDRLNEIRVDLDFDSFNIEVWNEVDYTTNKSLDPNTINVVIKYLSDTKLFSATTQPIQIIILSEENSLSVARAIFSKFEEKFNLNVVNNIFSSNIYVKQNYTNPVDLTNFQIVGVGYRTVLYVSGFLYILENVVDVKNIQLLNTSLEPAYEDLQVISSTIGYQASTDTQPLNSNISKSVKQSSVFTMTITTPCVESGIVERVLKIMNGTSNGNEDFSFKFGIGDISFTKNLKCSSVVFISALNNVPSIQIGFTE